MMSHRKGVRLRSKSKLQLQLKQQLHQTKGSSFYPVEKGLKSNASKRQYRWHLNRFIRWLEGKLSMPIIDEMIPQIDSRMLEGLLIEYMEFLHEQNHLKHSTVKSAMASVIHLCDLNDVILNRRKIGQIGLPADENSNQDRAYTREEIKKLIDNSDKRFKVVILLMANGMRVGALADLRLEDLTYWTLPTNEPNPPKVYQISVYARSTKGRYYTFVTPECTQAIDDYLEFRKSQHENINLDTIPFSPPDTPLIREQFRLNSRRLAAHPRKISQSSLEKTMERTIEKARIKTKNHVMMTHGLRKYAITMMAEADVRFSDREYLVGHKHSVGLDKQYYKPTEKKRLVAWSKAINFLTINPEYHLRHELKLIQGETNQKIAQLEAHNAKLGTVLKVKDEEYKALWKMQREQNAVIEELKEKFGEIKEGEQKKLGLDRIGIIEDCGDEI